MLAQEFTRSFGYAGTAIDIRRGTDVGISSERAVKVVHRAHANGFREGIEAAARVADDNRTDDDSMWDRAVAPVATAIRDLTPQTGGSDV